MKKVLVVSVIGADQLGLVERLAAVIAQQGGNWLESSFSRLAGQFAGIVKVAVNDNGAELLTALQALPALDIRGVLDAEVPETEVQSVALTLVGHDRIGIVKEVSSILAKFGVNVEQFTTWLDSAPMSGELLFHAQAILAAPEHVDLSAVRSALEDIADDLMVEWTQ